MPFGLKSAAQSFQKFTDGLFRDLPYVYADVDNILVVSAAPERHTERVKEVLGRLHAAGIVVNVTKCQFHQEVIDFLGYRVSPHGIQPDSKGVKPIVEYELPKEVKGLRRFLGMINFYRRSIPHASYI